MASSAEFLEFVLECFEPRLEITSKKMFGEYGLFSGGKMWGMVCDDRLFIKKTAGGEAFAAGTPEGAPYPGAKPIFLIEDRLDDREWLTELAIITRDELPTPKKRKKKG